MLKVEVQYVDFGNIEALPPASLREPTRAISHVNSLPFQVIHPTCLFVPCSLPPPPLTPSPFRYSTPLVFSCLPQSLSPLSATPPPCLIVSFSCCSLPLRVPLSICPHPPPLVLSSYKYPTPLVEFPSPLALFPYQVPLPNCLFVSHLTVFPLRYPTLMPYCVPPLLLSSLTSIPYLPFVSHLAVFPFRYPTRTPSCVPSRSLSFLFLLIQLSFLYFCQPFVIVAVISFILAYL